MAQVSESSANSPANLGPLQTRGPVRREADENSASGKVDSPKQDKSVQPASKEGDKVQLSREAQDPSRGSRVDEGKRNVDSLRPQSERIEDERGAAQKLNDLKNSNARGVRDVDESANQIETKPPSGNSSREADAAQKSREQAQEADDKQKIVEQQASDRKNPEVQLREFQTKDEIRIEPKIVSESVDEIKAQRDKAEAAKEPALEAPSQRIIQSESSTSSTGPERARSAESGVKNEQESSRKEPPNPVSAQTETGQNVDNLI